MCAYYSTVLLSGGQDSTTVLYLVKKYRPAKNILAVSFDYGQNHISELEAAKKIAKNANIAHKILDISGFLAPVLGNKIGGSLIDHMMEIVGETEEYLPSTFVPGRNLILLTGAALVSIGYFNIDIRDKSVEDTLALYLGVNEVDYSGYPDCREEFVEAAETALSSALGMRINVEAPLIQLTKSEIVLLAKNLGCLPALSHTVTCYRGMRPGCGECPSCKIRAKGFAQANITDPATEFVVK